MKGFFRTVRHRSAIAAMAALCAFASIATSARAQIVTEPEAFQLSFLAANGLGAAATHGASGATFDGVADTLVANFAFVSNLTVTTSQTSLGGGMWELLLSVTTGTNSGFLPAGITLGGQPVNIWALDVGDLFNAVGDGISTNAPITLIAAETEWFDNGASVVAFDSTGEFDATGNNIVGQTVISVGAGSDLGAFGSGIDAVTVKVTVAEVPEPASMALLAIGAMAVVRRRRVN